MTFFYEKNSDEFYKNSRFWKQERSFMAKENSKMLSVSEANRLRVDELFLKAKDDIKPRLNLDYEYVIIPYELDDKIVFEGKELVDHFVNIVNSNLSSEKKYIVSTDSDKCCAFEFSCFNSNIIWNLSVPHLNTNFIVFDDKKHFFALIDYDLPLQIIGFKKDKVPDFDHNKWINYFCEQWEDVQKKYRIYINLLPIIEEYYPFVFDILKSYENDSFIVSSKNE